MEYVCDYNIILKIIVFYFIVFSVAKCLGALRVCKRSYEWLQNDNVISCVVPDKEALKACVHMSGILNITIIITFILFLPLLAHCCLVQNFLYP